MTKDKFLKSKRRGAYLPVILMISVLFMALMTAMIAMAMSNLKIANNHRDKVSAMEIAEAGVNYYLWRLSHFNTDYCDGQSCVGNATIGYGPYNHDYTDVGGHKIGTYSLKIFPPSADSSTVRVESIGMVNGRRLQRKIICELGMPSFTKYTLFSQPQAPSGSYKDKSPELWVGPNEKITGSAFVNMGGIYNQGEITKDAYSTLETFDSIPGGDGLPGVAGPGVFGGAKIYPTTPVDINKLSVDIDAIRDDAAAGNGFYRNASGSNGYSIVLKADNFDLYRVTQYYGSFDVGSVNNADDLSVKSRTLLGTYDYPASGVMAFEDNVWVSGTINNKKITILAADPEETRKNFLKNIIITDNIKYTNYNGLDKIGLITQQNILVARKAPTNLEIDAAMIAATATDSVIRIKAYCSPNTTCLSDHKTKIKVFGSLAHRGGLLWTIDYGGGKWSGYQATETVIDEANVLNPPPKFPLTGSYQILSWREE